MEESRHTFMREVLRYIAPGTELRRGIDNVLRANTGGLIVLGYTDQLKEMVDGGFYINCAFSPAYLYELSKMDGAIILTADGSKILYANTQLVPNNDIPSSETGIRHRTAQRVAKQTGSLVVSVSQRRRVITLYKGEHRYSLREMEMILTKANQGIQTLDKYKSALDQSIINLGALEFEETVSFQDIAQVLHRTELVLRIKEEILNYVLELGTEGRLITMQLDELLAGMEQETNDLIKDYVKDPNTSAEAVLKGLSKLNRNELLNDNVIMRVLGHPEAATIQDQSISPRGYRILNKIKRLPPYIIENVVQGYGGLSLITEATIEELDEIEGIGSARAKKIKEGLQQIQEQLFLERHV
ncbi:diadenylate cyclase [Sinobaca qinghaiensis]|uniref:diadenylate cyclase n=1 Tax=Sinobaca qinghaiensis TaxID=342944 RepID=A0A419UTY1_9BACL|nr:DNA integrity scanning diadenylate cyclase DisA [Sinobaca qinghaiensis]RKD67530.1 diadenylate cyclase [Sinobaca qinghaiensis]